MMNENELNLWTNWIYFVEPVWSHMFMGVRMYLWNDVIMISVCLHVYCEFKHDPRQLFENQKHEFQKFSSIKYKFYEILIIKRPIARLFVMLLLSFTSQLKNTAEISLTELLLLFRRYGRNLSFFVQATNLMRSSEKRKEIPNRWSVFSKRVSIMKS